MSETCCTRLAGNAGRKKVAKNRHLGTIAQLCQAIFLVVPNVQLINKGPVYLSECFCITVPCLVFTAVVDTV